VIFKSLGRLSNQRQCARTIDHRRTWHLSAIRGLCLSLCPFALGAYEAAQAPISASPAITAQDAQSSSARPEKTRMWMTVGEHRFTITLADTAAARAFSERLPLTLDMSDLNGNEKHASLPEALPANASRPGTIRSGDLMLYGTDTLVVFYLTFDSSYPYTRIARVDDLAGLAQALGPKGARITFTR
jgi:hypothetical protein